MESGSCEQLTWKVFWLASRDGLIACDCGSGALVFCRPSAGLSATTRLHAALMVIIVYPRTLMMPNAIFPYPS